MSKNHLINPIYRVDISSVAGHMDTELFYDIEKAVAHVKEWREALEDNPLSIPVGGVHVKITLEEVISYQIVE
jgi:hypothetical protein